MRPMIRLQHWLRMFMLGCFLGCVLPGFAQQNQNVMLVTLDGVRWQEVFAGADSTLLFDPAYSPDTAAAHKQFWAANPIERREKLLPFCWNTLAKKGQLYGNRLKNSRVNVANPYWFSYPGYNEMLTGFADERINSNDKKANPNTTVLEFLNKQPKLQDKVAVFSSWDVIEAVVNESRSGIYANSANEPLTGHLTGADTLLNSMMKQLPSQFNGVRQDFLTYYAAKTYLRQHQPRVLFVSFDETDDLAHAGKYLDHLHQLQAIDGFLADLWNTLQTMPQYAGKTTLLVTTDHGRGHTPKARWKDHGTKTPDSYQMWLGAIGPDTPATGEQTGGDVLFQQQIAATLARLMGYDFRAEHTVAPAIPGVLR